MRSPLTYSGPFEAPPEHLLKGAIGWRHEKKHNGDGTWSPTAFMIVYPASVLLVGLDGIPFKDSVLWAA